MPEREEQVNPLEGSPPPRAAEPSWNPEPNPVESFTSTIEHALRQLSVELAAIRAERDGLRLELEGLRAQHDLLRQQLQNRDRFDATVRELGEIIRTLNVPVGWVEPAPPTPQPPAPTWTLPPVPPMAPVTFQAPPPSVPPAPAPPPPPSAAPTPPAPEPGPFAWADPTPAPGDVDWSTYLGPTTQPVPAATPPAAAAPAAVEVPIGAPPPAPRPEPVAGDVPAAVWVPAPPPEVDEAPAAPEVDEAPVAPEADPEAAPQPQPAPTASFRDLPTPGADPLGLQVLDGNVWEVPAGGATRRAGGRRSHHRLRTFGRWAGTGVAVFLILAMALVAVGPKVLPYQTFFVRSGSMEPTIEVGELIFLTRVDASDLEQGDIITFERPDRPGTMVTHRITAIETTDQGKVFQTKGDANGSPDVWRVPASGEGWKYAFGIPKAGYVFGYLNTSQARLALLAVPVLILGLLSLVDIWRPKAKPAARARR